METYTKFKTTAAYIVSSSVLNWIILQNIPWHVLTDSEVQFITKFLLFLKAILGTKHIATEVPTVDE